MSDDTKAREWTLGYYSATMPRDDEIPDTFICNVRGSFVSHGGNVDVIEYSVYLAVCKERDALRAKLTIAREALKYWVDFEDACIAKDGPYVSPEIPKRIARAKEALEKIGDV